MHLRLVSARLITLLRLMRESGGHEYGRSIDLNSLNPPAHHHARLNGWTIVQRAGGLHGP